MSETNGGGAADAPRRGLIHAVGPGILVAATGVGAGDLATGALSGSRLGLAVLWAVVLGAAMKFVLNEGLARWQLATGDTLLEGCARHFGRPVLWIFLAYLLAWSYLVGAALMGACGVTSHALLPLADDPATDKVIYGMACSAVAVALVLLGGYRLFEKVMSVCIGVMCVTVLAAAVLIGPDWAALIRGLLVPTIPDAGGQGISWTVGLMGGVGGTLTVLCYGYWIREEGREGVGQVRACRIDLAAGYTMTAVFGIGMVVLGSRIAAGGSGATLVVDLGRELQTQLGPLARWAFLIGAWGAVLSSLLGVWQSVPYLFADVLRLLRGRYDEDRIDTRGRAYVGYLLLLATVPACGLWTTFSAAQLAYAVVGAAFMPPLAAALLLLNRRRHVGAAGNSWLAVAALVMILAFFLAAGGMKVAGSLGG